MKLNKFFKNLKKDYKHLTFKGFAFNSEKIKKKFIFFAKQGTKFNGNNFKKDAIRKGAKIIVKLPKNLKRGLAEDVSKIMRPNSGKNASPTYPLVEDMSKISELQISGQMDAQPSGRRKT